MLSIKAFGVSALIESVGYFMFCCSKLIAYIFIMFFFAISVSAGGAKEDCITQLDKSESSVIKKIKIDGFIVGILAGVILNPGSIISSGKLELYPDDTLHEFSRKNNYLPKIDWLGSNKEQISVDRKKNDLQTSYRMLGNRDILSKLTVGELINQLGRCDEYEIDWALLDTRLGTDIAFFHEENSFMRTTPVWRQREINDNPIFSELMQNKTPISSFEPKNKQALKECIELGQLFPTFFGLKISEWRSLEREYISRMNVASSASFNEYRNSAVKPHEGAFDKLIEKENFTVASLAEGMLYAQEYLKLPVDWDAVKSAVPSMQDNAQPSNRNKEKECSICLDGLDINKLAISDEGDIKASLPNMQVNAQPSDRNKEKNAPGLLARLWGAVKYVLPSMLTNTQPSNSTCRICFEKMNISNMVPLGCGHVHCSVCTEKLDTCSVCRAPASDRIKLYFN